jgi:hypothetical protein
MTNAANPSVRRASDERFFGWAALGSIAGFAGAGMPTCSE